jgi:hypothetical protein
MYWVPVQEIAGIPKIANRNSNFLTLQKLEFQKKSDRNLWNRKWNQNSASDGGPLLAIPLGAILAEIECDDKAHNAQALPTSTSPHPSSMLLTPPCLMTYEEVVLSTMEGSTCAMSLALAPLALPLPTINGQFQAVRQHAWPCCCTGHNHCPCAPSPPDKVLPPHPHPMLGGLPTPTKTHTMLVQATSPCCSVMSSPTASLMTSSTPSLLPFTFSSKAHLSLGGGTAHSFCVGDQSLLPWKCSQHKHCPQCAGGRHGPWAPNPQKHLLNGQCHWPCAPNK